MRLPFKAIVQWCKRCRWVIFRCLSTLGGIHPICRNVLLFIYGVAPIRLPIGAPQRQPDQVIGKVRIFWQERAMHVCSIGIAIDSPFRSLFRVIAIALEHFSQGLSSAQVGATAMILKTNQRAPIPVNRDISNTTRATLPLVN